MGRRTVLAVAAAAAVIALAGATLLSDSTPTPLEPGDPIFAAERLTWAQGSEVHYGRQTFDLGPEVVRSALRTPYGFFLDLARSPRYRAPHRLVFYDGTTSVELPGNVKDPAVSPDGRYAGWIDFDGPLRPAGRIAEVVVVDLASGEAIFRDHDGMGGGVGDDLTDRYEELPPAMLGFDDDGLVYWLDAEGSGHRWRADPVTGEKELVDAPEPSDDGWDQPGLGEPYNPRLGREAGWLNGQLAPRGTGGHLLHLSPEERFGVDLGRPGRVLARDVRAGRRVRFDHGRRTMLFAGWAGPDRLFAFVSDQHLTSYDPTPPDPTTGVFMSCRLPSGGCTQVGPRSVTGAGSVVFGDGRSKLDVY